MYMCKGFEVREIMVYVRLRWLKLEEEGGDSSELSLKRLEDIRFFKI